MTINETTIDEIIESEKIMLLEWENFFWEFYTHAFDINRLLNNCTKSISKPDYFIFVSFLSQIKKHLTLALFSALRRHHTQTWMNLRQGLEAISWAVYAMWNKEEEKFCVKTWNWWLDVPEKLEKWRNKWITENFPKHSQTIKDLKKIINSSVAHSNIIYTLTTFDFTNIRKWIFWMSFFDTFDDFMIKNDLWFVSNITLLFLDLSYRSNEKFKIIEFKDNFTEDLYRYWEQNSMLKQKLMKHPRYIESINNK